MKYEVEIKETLLWRGIIEAEAKEDALQRLKSLYYGCAIVLGSSDYVGTEFKVTRLVKRQLSSRPGLYGVAGVDDVLCEVAQDAWHLAE